MIISHKYKYLFVEIPHTASTAISLELRENYDGSKILHKHATYENFLRIATPEEKKYFVFAGIRNPLDEAVTIYFKYKTDHRQKWTKPGKVNHNKRLFTFPARKRYRFIRDTGADFSTYFEKFCTIPYNNLSFLSYRRIDFVIRFEDLQKDFARALELIGIEPIRPLPVINKTNGREKDFLTYYTPEVVAQAKRVFGPFMKQWGYEFPPEWGETSVPWWDRMEFDFFNLGRNLYWKHFKFRT